MSQSLEQDIRSWIISRMMSFSLAIISKRSNAPEVAFCQFSGMLHTATSMPAPTLGKWWTGSRASFWWPKKVILQYSTTATKWWMPLPPQNGLQAQEEQSSHEVSLLVLEWRPYLVLLAQTRVGFLSGGRGKSFRQLAPQEQREEAFARATVALTRAQQICLIMGPLDMRGLVGAATIMGCLKYGASFSGLGDQDDPVLLFRLKDEDLLEAPDDSAFLQSLRFSCARVNGVYPPLALAEAFITEEDSAPRVRRLHLIVVDLHRRRRLADRVRRLFSDIQVDRCANECWNTLPHPVEAKSRGLPAPICLWICNGWQWPSVLHALAHSDCGAILLVHWCLERWLGSTGQMFFHCSGGNWTLLWCLLPSPAKALASSCMPSFEHSFLPCCRGHPSGTFACE